MITLNEAVDWRSPDQLHPYRGIFKLFIVLPDDLYLPVIPERINGKLVDFKIIKNKYVIDFSFMSQMCN